MKYAYGFRYNGLTMNMSPFGHFTKLLAVPVYVYNIYRDFLFAMQIRMT